MTLLPVPRAHPGCAHVRLTACAHGLRVCTQGVRQRQHNGHGGVHDHGGLHSIQHLVCATLPSRRFVLALCVLTARSEAHSVGYKQVSGRTVSHDSHHYDKLLLRLALT